MPLCHRCRDYEGRHYTVKLECLCTTCKNEAIDSYTAYALSLYVWGFDHPPKYFRSKKAAQLYLIEQTLFK